MQRTMSSSFATGPSVHRIAPHKSLRQKSIRNCTASPLLRLPRELRDRVWEFTLGGCIVHIGVFGHWLCLVDSSTSPASSSSLSSSPPTPPAPAEPAPEQTAATTAASALALERRKLSTQRSDFFDREQHVCCPAPGRRRELHLGLLRVARQMYFECTRVLYATNMFIFLELGSLESFMAAVAPWQRRFITSMQLSVWKKDLVKIQNGTTDVKPEDFLSLCHLKTLKIHLRR